jgi:sugar/nucleoside kinase (ribokinase family)
MTPTLALVVGHVTLDRSPAGAIPGGSAYYAAHALAALGASVRVLTAAGADYPREALRFPATSTSTSTGSIDALILPSPSTTTFENTYGEGGRRTQRVHAAARPLDPTSLPAAWRDADLLLLAPVLGELVPAAFAAAVRARAAGLCVQGLVREVLPGGAVAPRSLEVRADVLAGLGLVVLGEDEAAGQPGLAAALAAVVPLVAFTHGERGCELLSSAGARRVGVHPAREVDPTGAGDVFAAAMLLGLARGDAPAEAARLGAAAASIVVEGCGGEALGRVGEAWERRRGIPDE